MTTKKVAVVTVVSALFLAACGDFQRQEKVESVCDQIVEYTIHRAADGHYEGSAKIGHLVVGSCRNENFRMRQNVTRIETTAFSLSAAQFVIEARVNKYLAMYPRRLSVREMQEAR